MAITTSLQTKFTVQKVLVIVICLVMGLWGVYDYTVKIPRQARAYQRGQLCLHVKQALEQEPGSAEARDAIDRAAASLNSEMETLFQRTTDRVFSPDELKQAVEAIKERNEETWLAVLLMFRDALGEAAQRGSAVITPSAAFAATYEIAKEGVNQTADISPPSRFDRATQWLFILCLPFIPYFVWSLLRARGQRYRLEDDGTLTSPMGTWGRDEIADIDMSRWMAKSVAHAVHEDGRRLKLDDYVYRDMHLIVGALASERYPEEWEADARRRKDDGAPPAEPAAAAIPGPPVDALDEP